MISKLRGGQGRQKGDYERRVEGSKCVLSAEGHPALGQRVEFVAGEAEARPWASGLNHSCDILGYWQTASHTKGFDQEVMKVRTVSRKQGVKCHRGTLPSS